MVTFHSSIQLVLALRFFPLFQHGFAGNGITLAEFSFNSWNGLDFYDLSVINGFNVPMQIRASTGGPTVTCKLDYICI